jgi:hypothetical protein
MRSRHQPTPEVQNEGRQMGSGYISRSTTDRHAVSTAIPGFSESPDSMESATTSVDVDRYRKRKMATAKPEVVISHNLQHIDMRFQRLYPLKLCHPTRLRMRENPKWLIKLDDLSSNSGEI